MGLADDQCERLRDALNQLHPEKAEDVFRMSQLERTASVPSVRAWSFFGYMKRPAKKPAKDASKMSAKSTGDIQERFSESHLTKNQTVRRKHIRQWVEKDVDIQKSPDVRRRGAMSDTRRGVPGNGDVHQTKCSLSGHFQQMVTETRHPYQDNNDNEYFDKHGQFGKEGTMDSAGSRPGTKSSLEMTHSDQIKQRTGSNNANSKLVYRDAESPELKFQVDTNSNRLSASFENKEGMRAHNSLVDDVMCFEMGDIEHLLELMVEKKIMNTEIQKSTLSETSDQNVKRRVQALLKMTDQTDIRNLERRHRLRHRLRRHAENEGNDVTSDNWQLEVPCKKQVTFDLTEGRPKSNTSMLPHPAENPAHDIPLAHTNGISNSNFCIDAEIFIVNNSDCGGQVNPFFEYSDGRDERPNAVLQTFGHKGRDYGKLQDASSVVCTASGDVIVTDFINGKVQVFDCAGKPSREIRIKAGRGPWNITMSPYGWIAVTYRGSKKLTVISHDGEEMFSAGGDMFESPAGLAVDLEGRFIVTDSVTNKIYRVWCDHALVHTECLHLKDVQLKQARYVTVSPTGNIIVSDTGNHCVKILTPDGHLKRSIGQYGRLPGDFRSPYAVCCDHHGNIIVADHYNNRVTMFNSSGVFLRHLLSEGHGLNRPQGLHISVDGKLYVTHGKMKASEVLVFDLTEGEEGGRRCK
ncbi:uncharacterized protein LOC135463113 [Liolophura sinensis]|uniref:uncharacterized protein LOC135463113 n=1 Tax=Liolophura sinensis TaxID=3198878 RepID=UPI003158C0C4